MTLRLMIVAGEPSGDAHSAALVTSAARAVPEGDIEFFGATGPKMRAAGVKSFVDTDELAIFGIIEVGTVLHRFWKVFRTLKALAAESKPDAVILVDWPEFNLKLARSLHRMGLRVIYYISPQLWAWRSYRLRSIKRDVDLLISILPFEPGWYARRGVTHVEFVGNPLTGEVLPKYGKDEFCRRNHLDPDRPIISLLPGSRRKELENILPVLLRGALQVFSERPEIQFVIPVAPGRTVDEVNLLIERSGASTLLESGTLRVTSHETYECLTASDAAAVASGTATLETALIGVPFVIVYVESAINWHTLGRLISAEHFGLINLIAERRLITELIQNEFTPDSVSKELLWLLDRKHNAELHEQLAEAVAKLGGPGASDRAAKAVLDALARWYPSENLSVALANHQGKLSQDVNAQG